MATQFTPCPACGAVGEVGSNCQFCGTTIILKEGATFSDARIIKQRTITPQQYAEKISIYHNIEGLCDGVSKVSIGEQEGIVNLNGDLIYPLGNEHISKSFQDSVVRIGDKFLNLENFEYVDNLYLNKTIIDKISAILNNPYTDGYISFNNTFCIVSTANIQAWWDGVFEPKDDYPNDSFPQLALYYGTSDLIDGNDDVRDYNQFASCECFRLFKTVSKESITGELLQPHERGYYMLCKDDAEYCCATLLQVLSQVYNIPPKNATECMEYNGELFEDNNYNENHSVNSTPSSNSGCAGMLALMLGIGGASVYGIVELISRLIA